VAGLTGFVKNWLVPPGLAAHLTGSRWLLQLYLNRSSEDRRLLKQTASLKDRHVGQRCFVMGAGRSIASQDVKKLAGECVISVSNTFVHPDMSVIRPRYHVVPHMIYGHGRLYKDEYFVRWLRDMEAGTFEADMFFHIKDRKMIETNELFRNRCIHWVDHASWNGNMNMPIDLRRVPPIWSVSELAVTIAVYMGFEKIYLIGIDHDWFNGPLVYFYDHKTQHAMKPDEKNLDWVDSEFQMRRHADIFRKYKYLYSFKKNIYNANGNPNHYLDTFPKVDYDSLF